MPWDWFDGPRPEEATAPHRAGRWLPPSSVCSPCETAAAAAARAVELRRELAAAGLPPRFQGYRFDRFERLPTGGDWQAFRAALPEGVLGITSWNVTLARRLREDAARPSRSTYVVGPVGSGKTTLAAAAVVASVSAGVSVFYVTESDLWERSREERRRRAKEATSILYVAARVRLLVLDDFGVCEDGRDWQYDAMETLVQRRYDHRLPTLITSNVNLQDVGDRYGQRVASRLYEMCRGEQVLLAGVNWRTGEVAPAPPPRAAASSEAAPEPPTRHLMCASCGYSPCRCGAYDHE